MSKVALYGAVASAALLVPSATWAQELPAGDRAAPKGISSGGIGEIVVTARKQAERDIDVPIAMSAVTAQGLEKYSTSTLSDVAKLTPQLLIGTTLTATGAVINLRGIGGDAFVSSVEQPVSLNLDGVQASQGNVALLGVHDLARVEVLKGPQALFYGKNSPAGIISLISNNPGDELELLARAGYEFANQQKYTEAVVSGPLSDSVGARIALYASDQNGWFRNAANPVPGLVGPAQRRAPGQQELFGRVTLTYKAPGGGFNSNLKVNISDVNRNYGWGTNFQVFACPQGQPALTIGQPGANTDCKLDRNYVLGDMDPATAATDGLYRDGVLYGRSRQYMGVWTNNIDLSDTLSLAAVSGYYKSRDVSSGSFGATEITHVTDASDLKLEQYSQELRLTSHFDGPINVMVGGYYQNAKYEIVTPVSFGPLISPTPFLVNKISWDQTTKAASAFGQITYQISEKVKLNVGARYSHEKKDFSAYQFASATSPLNEPLILAYQARKFNNLSPEATVTYSPISDVNVYATYRTGFKSGGFNFSTFIPQGADIGFNQEKVKGGEVGVKGLLADRQIKLQAATYHYKYSGLQLADYDPTTLATSILNVGAATIYGAELAVLYAPRSVEGLSLNGSIGYNHGRFDRYIAPCYGGQTAALGCNLRPDSTTGVFSGQDFKGNQLVRSPDWSLNAGAEYTAAVSGGLKVNIAADAFYSSSFFTDSNQDPRSKQNSFWKLNARIALAGEDNSWEIALIGKNLTNKLTLVTSNGVSFTGSGTGTAGPAILQDLGGSLAEPRTIGLQVTWRPKI